VFVKYDKGDKLEALKAVVRHEQFHKVLNNLGGYARGDALLNHDNEDIRDSAQKATRALGKLGYDASDKSDMWAEIGAHLAGGPLHWDKINLTADEAIPLFKEYLNLVDDKTLDRMDRITPQLKETLYAARAAAATRQEGNRADEETESGDQERDIRGGSAQSVSPAKGRSREKWRTMIRRLRPKIAKVFLAHMVHKVVDTAIQLHGALGYSQDTPLASWYTHIRSQRLVDGPDEVHRWTVGRNVIKAYQAHGTTASAAGGDLI
jgi:hypothetical protein